MIKSLLKIFKYIHSTDATSFLNVKTRLKASQSRAAVVSDEF